MKNLIRKGCLYIIATPIGNLMDITLRALNVLRNADLILAEDTRVTMKLLNYYEIDIPEIISCHDHNECDRLPLVQDSLKKNKTIVLVSDSGTPLISDPGFKLLKSLRTSKTDIIPIPGASALTAAISISNIPVNSFNFIGFLPPKKNTRLSMLLSIKLSTITTILYESKHRIIKSLEDIALILPDNRLMVAKEITKLNEAFFTGRACEILEKNREDFKRGEFVIIIEGTKQNKKSEVDNILMNFLLEEGISKRRICKVLNMLTDIKKSEIYKKILLSTKKDF